MDPALGAGHRRAQVVRIRLDLGFESRKDPLCRVVLAFSQSTRAPYNLVLYKVEHFVSLNGQTAQGNRVNDRSHRKADEFQHGGRSRATESHGCAGRPARGEGESPLR
jgi:hypothetical protein